ncbi:hypothetical protein RchiOBHm_Chr6g0246911 [Rosa chinensis]|uniref:Uncharacterized protein n=1 Tax=Rosa chinensis TaxID=74649 RepID=A0A2P6PJN0_ROSCH|nr:hypothetical protein RchiOBHm_Chr6g0246911 [Rosa chinensis]
MSLRYGFRDGAPARLVETELRHIHRDAARHGHRVAARHGHLVAARHGHLVAARHGIFVLLFLLWYGIVERPVNIRRGGGACEHSKRRWSMEGRRSQPLWCLEYLL